MRGDNDWKFEFVVLKNEYRIFRMKVYDKSLDKLSTVGVAYNDPHDPLFKLMLTNNKVENAHNKDLFSYKG